MDIMYNRKNGKRYEVYHYFPGAGDHMIAVCYDTEQAGSCGQGWCRMRLKDLVPEAHANKFTGQYMSNTKRNAVKRQLKLSDAVWTCTDGITYDHRHLDDAIEHQRQIMESGRSPVYHESSSYDDDEIPPVPEAGDKME